MKQSGFDRSELRQSLEIIILEMNILDYKEKFIDEINLYFLEENYKKKILRKVDILLMMNL